MIHQICLLLLDDRLFLAPVVDLGSKRVLDIGTGTGAWAIDLANAYPATEIVGNDLSPSQLSWHPPNIQFIVDNTELEWVEPHPYDFIHSRNLAGSIRDWPNLVRQIYENLNPNGWVEFQEFTNTLYSSDGTLHNDNPLALMMDGLTAACEKVGRTFHPAISLKSWVEEAGFVDVEQRSVRVPIGSWPKDKKLKEIGVWTSASLSEGFEALTAVLFQDVLGWDAKELRALERKVQVAVQQRQVHACMDFKIIFGRKPG